MKLHLLYIGDAWLSNSSLELLAVCTSFEKAVELAVEHSKNIIVGYGSPIYANCKSINKLMVWITII